jgi:hypothetical protein
MTPLFAEDISKPSWHCVHFTDSAPLPESLSGHGVHAVGIEGSEIASKPDLMSSIAGALDFPDHFGANWDALDDSLRDLSWLGERNHALIVSGAESLWRQHPDLAGGLVESWLGAAGRWADLGIGFHLVFEW